MSRLHIHTYWLPTYPLLATTSIENHVFQLSNMKFYGILFRGNNSEPWTLKKYVISNIQNAMIYYPHNMLYPLTFLQKEVIAQPVECLIQLVIHPALVTLSGKNQSLIEGQKRYLMDSFVLAYESEVSIFLISIYPSDDFTEILTPEIDFDFKLVSKFYNFNNLDNLNDDLKEFLHKVKPT